jgi:hypothetical protein
VRQLAQRLDWISLPSSNLSQASFNESESLNASVFQEKKPAPTERRMQASTAPLAQARSAVKRLRPSLTNLSGYLHELRKAS